MSPRFYRQLVHHGRRAARVHNVPFQADLIYIGVYNEKRAENARVRVRAELGLPPEDLQDRERRARYEKREQAKSGQAAPPKKKKKK